MNGNEYVRALLYAYPKMKMLADAVREGARVRAVLSFRFPRDTLSRMEGIAADMEYAERLLVWKGELDHILSGCDEDELFLLEYKYFRRRRVLDSMNKDGALSCSERSYFRHQNAVLEKVAGALIRRGCTKEAFYSDFEGFSPVMRIVSALEKVGSARWSPEGRTAGSLLRKIRSRPFRRGRAPFFRVGRRMRSPRRQVCPRRAPRSRSP